MNICTLKLAYPYGNNAPDDWFCIQTSFSRLPNMPAPCSLPYAYKFEYLIYKFLHIISHLIDYIRKTSSAFFTQSFSLFISITPWFVYISFWIFFFSFYSIFLCLFLVFLYSSFLSWFLSGWKILARFLYAFLAVISLYLGTLSMSYSSKDLFKIRSLYRSKSLLAHRHAKENKDRYVFLILKT